MAHDCPECGEVCFCDGDDTWFDDADDCTHNCEPEEGDDDDDGHDDRELDRFDDDGGCGGW